MRRHHLTKKIPTYYLSCNVSSTLQVKKTIQVVLVGLKQDLVEDANEVQLGYIDGCVDISQLNGMNRTTSV